MRWLAGELVREAVFEQLSQELPYGMAVDALDLVLAVVEWGVEIIPVPLRRSLAGRRVAAS